MAAKTGRKKSGGGLLRGSLGLLSVSSSSEEIYTWDSLHISLSSKAVAIYTPHWEIQHGIYFYEQSDKRDIAMEMNGKATWKLFSFIHSFIHWFADFYAVQMKTHLLKQHFHCWILLSYVPALWPWCCGFTLIKLTRDCSPIILSRFMSKCFCILSVETWTMYARYILEKEKIHLILSSCRLRHIIDLIDYTILFLTQMIPSCYYEAKDDRSNHPADFIVYSQRWRGKNSRLEIKLMF